MSKCTVDDLVGALRKGDKKTVLEARECFPSDSETSVNILLALAELQKNGSSRKDLKVSGSEVTKIRKRIVGCTPENVEGIFRKLFARKCAIFLPVLFMFGAESGDFEQAKLVFRLLTKCIYQLWLSSQEQENSDTAYLAELFNAVFTTLPLEDAWSNLIFLVQDGDSEARILLKRFLFIFHICTYEVKVIPYSSKQEVIEEILHALERAPRNPDMLIKLYVKEEYVSVVERLEEEIEQESQGDNVKINGLLDWFKENLPYFRRQIDKMWEDIIYYPRYGLRDNGKDRVRICIKTIQDCVFSYRMLEFRPEGHVYPRVGVFFHLDVYELHAKIGMILSPEVFHELEQELGFKSNEDEKALNLMDMLLTFVAVHCYWQIVCGKDQQFDPSCVSTTNGKTIKRSDRISPVREAVRRLPEGHKASERAKRLAIQHHKHLPPTGGYTFVSKHERNPRGAEALNNEPLFSYRDNDMGFLVKEQVSV